MRRSAILLLTLIFLLSGMNVTVATHYCGGKVARVKFSLSGLTATCGMESDQSAAPSKECQIKTHCCYDEVMVYEVENLFSYSVSDFKVLAQKTLPYAGIPVNIFLPVPSYNQHNYADYSPPGYYTVNSVRVDEICCFRI
jgi:hypothetical protein